MPTTMTHPGQDPTSAWRETGLDSLMIELATRDHVPYLRRLKESVMRSRYRPADDADEFQRWCDVYCTDQYFLSLLDDPSVMMLCIGNLREPVGMAILHRHEDYLEIDDLMVLHPGSGNGTRLLRACLQYAEAWRLPRVVIDVYPGHDTAETFLESHGFERAEASSNELGRPMHRYARSLTA